MSSIISLIKNTMAKKVVVEEVKDVVCANCEASGKECNVCGAGKDVV